MVNCGNVPRVFAMHVQLKAVAAGTVGHMIRSLPKPTSGGVCQCHVAKCSVVNQLSSKRET